MDRSKEAPTIRNLSPEGLRSVDIVNGQEIKDVVIDSATGEVLAVEAETDDWPTSGSMRMLPIPSLPGRRERPGILFVSHSRMPPIPWIGSGTACRPAPRSGTGSTRRCCSIWACPSAMGWRCCNGCEAKAIGSPVEPGRKDALDNAESYITIIRLPEDPLPHWLAPDLPASFHTLRADGERLRSFKGAGRRWWRSRPRSAKESA